MRRWLGVGAVGAVVIGFALAVGLSSGGGGGGGSPPPGRNPARKPPPQTLQVGANVNYLFNVPLLSDAQVAAQLRALRATGANVARTDALWEAAEPDPPSGNQHHYDWSFDDRVAGALATAGLQWSPGLEYTAPWAASVPGNDHSQPRNPIYYADWAQAFAARYGAGGSFWREHPNFKTPPVQTFEIWNEPDNQAFWQPAPDPDLYGRMYLLARSAITAVDPSARVIVGGLTHPAGFLPAMLHDEPALAGHIDGVAIHPYGDTPLLLLGRLRNDRAAMDALGMQSVPLYVTEFGWATKPPGAPAYASPAARRSYISSVLPTLAHSNCRLAAVILYTWVTPERDLDNREDWFGIAPPGGGPSPDVAAFSAAVHQAQARAPTVKLCTH